MWKLIRMTPMANEFGPAPTRFGRCVLERSGYMSIRELARQIDVDHARLYRQLHGQAALSPHLLFSLARFLDIPFGVALEAAEWITESEAKRTEPSLAIRHYSDKELLAEMMRRIDSGDMEDRMVGE